MSNDAFFDRRGSNFFVKGLPSSVKAYEFKYCVLVNATVTKFTLVFTSRSY